MNKNDMKFQNAVSSLKNRVSVKKYYFEDLPQDLRNLAFTVADLETLRQIEMIKQSLDNAVENGESFASWRDNLDVETIQSLSNARLETVYRTNVHNVYNQSTLYNAVTSDVTPYLMYDAVGDERTRPEHMQLDGTIKKGDSDFWRKYTPPLGYNCRCGIIPLSLEDAKSIGISNKGVDKFPEPEKGFGTNKMGDVTSQVSKSAEEAIKEMKPSALKSKFKAAQENRSTLVDIWWQKNKNIFEQGEE